MAELKYPPLRNLRAEMARNGMTSSDLAAAVGVSDTTVRQWLRGRSVPNVHHAARVAAVFDGLTIEYLFEE